MPILEFFKSLLNMGSCSSNQIHPVDNIHIKLMKVVKDMQSEMK